MNSYVSERESDIIDGEVHYAINTMVQKLIEQKIIDDVDPDTAFVLEDYCTHLQNILKSRVGMIKRDGRRQSSS